MAEKIKASLNETIKNGATPSGALSQPGGFSALHPVFRRKVWHEFLNGASTLRPRRKYSLTRRVVEAIIREHLK